MSKTNDIKSVIERMIQNGVIPMDEADYDRCMFTGDLLDDIPFTIYNKKEININELYENTLNSFTMYNDKDLLTRLSDLLKSIILEHFLILSIEKIMDFMVLKVL